MGVRRTKVIFSDDNELMIERGGVYIYTVSLVDESGSSVVLHGRTFFEILEQYFAFKTARLKGDAFDEASC